MPAALLPFANVSERPADWNAESGYITREYTLTIQLPDCAPVLGRFAFEAFADTWEFQDYDHIHGRHGWMVPEHYVSFDSGTCRVRRQDSSAWFHADSLPLALAVAEEEAGRIQALEVEADQRNQDCAQARDEQTSCRVRPSVAEQLAGLIQQLAREACSE